MNPAAERAHALPSAPGLHVRPAHGPLTLATRSLALTITYARIYRRPSCAPQVIHRPTRMVKSATDHTVLVRLQPSPHAVPSLAPPRASSKPSPPAPACPNAEHELPHLLPPATRLHHLTSKRVRLRSRPCPCATGDSLQHKPGRGNRPWPLQNPPRHRLCWHRRRHHRHHRRQRQLQLHIARERR